MAVEVARIRQSALGHYLDDDDAGKLAPLMRERELAGGEVLVAEGDAAPTLYLLIEGALEVTTGKQNHAVHTMRPGECAGTQAFVEHTPRHATLTARGMARVYSLDSDALEDLLPENPRAVYNLMRGLVSVTHANLTQLYSQSEQLTNYVMRMHGRY